MRDAKVALSPRFDIEIGDYHVRPVEASPLTILTTEAALLELQRMDLLPGRGVGIVLRGSTLAIADLNRWTEWDKQLAYDADFFSRKAIGWALRDHAGSDPTWVRAFVVAHPGLSGLSRREALKHLG